MRLLLSILAIGAGLLSASQTEAGLSGSRLAEYREDVRSYATCTVRNHHDRARELVLANVDNHTMERKFADIYTSKKLAFIFGCKELMLRGDQGIVVDPDLYRASLADVLVNKDLKVVEVGSFDSVGPLTHLAPQSASDFEAAYAKARSNAAKETVKKARDASVAKAWLSQFGECVVRRDQATAKEWLLTKPESAEEASAIGKATPALGACLVAGEKLTFDKHVLRGTVAINYYRLAMAKSQAGVSR
ncbi:MAG: hypothetical protein KGZ65_04790 [Sphingomonadales bacterium]|nr:hypothetical protein [Sphingomonadales bacterium]